MTWYVYILSCKDGYLYTGITNNLTRRIKEHNFDNRLGSKFVRSHRPALLVRQELFKTKRQALKRELEIKGWKKKKKIQLINGPHLTEQSEGKRGPESR